MPFGITPRSWKPSSLLAALNVLSTLANSAKNSYDEHHDFVCVSVFHFVPDSPNRTSEDIFLQAECSSCHPTMRPKAHSLGHNSIFATIWETHRLTVPKCYTENVKETEPILVKVCSNKVVQTNVIQFSWKWYVTLPYLDDRIYRSILDVLNDCSKTTHLTLLASEEMLLHWSKYHLHTDSDQLSSFSFSVLITIRDRCLLA